MLGCMRRRVNNNSMVFRSVASAAMFLCRHRHKTECGFYNVALLERTTGFIWVDYRIKPICYTVAGALKVLRSRSSRENLFSIRQDRGGCGRPHCVLEEGGRRRKRTWNETRNMSNRNGVRQIQAQTKLSTESYHKSSDLICFV